MRKRIIKGAVAAICAAVLAMQPAAILPGQPDVMRVNAASGKNMSITKGNVKKGKVTLSKKTLQNLTIKKSAGKAQINLKNVKVKGTLTIEKGALCQIKSSNSSFAKINIKGTAKKYISLSLDKQSKAGQITTAGNAKIVNKGNVGTVALNPAASARMNVSLTGIKGNLNIKNVKNVKVSLKLKECSLKNVKVQGKAKGSTLTFAEAYIRNPSVMKKLQISDTTSLNLNAAADAVTILSKAKNTKVKMAKGITVKNLKTYGNGVKVSGSGKIKSAYISGNNTKISVKTGKVQVKKGTTGVVVNGKQYSQTPSKPETPDKPDTPSKPDIPSKPEEEITYTVIFDAGTGIIAGTGEKTVTRKVKKGNKITNVPSAYAEWKDFKGWSKTGNEDLIDFSVYTVTGNVTLKAFYPDKLQTNLRVSLGEGISYSSETGKMVINGTLEEAISPKETPNKAGFVMENIGDNTVNIAVYSLNDCKITVRLTKGTKYPGTEEITGIKIPGYGYDGSYFTGLPEGDYRITCSLDSNSKVIVSRPLFIRKGAYTGQ